MTSKKTAKPKRLNRKADYGNATARQVAKATKPTGMSRRMLNLG